MDKAKQTDDRKKVRLPAELSAEIAQIALDNQKVSPTGRIEGPTQTEIVEEAVRSYINSRKKDSENSEEDRIIGKVFNTKKETVAPRLVTRRDVHELLDEVMNLAGTSDPVRCIAQYLSSLGTALEHVPQEVGRVAPNKRQDKLESPQHSTQQEKIARMRRARSIKQRGGIKESPTRDAETA